MPLPENLLSPIPGPSPSGENLYYSALYDKIKEARREEEEISQGEWQRDIKKADYSQVIKLTTGALASQSKDLQLAAWLTEALLQREGIAGLADGLNLLRGLLEGFWDTLYPELEDGDAEFRATPLEWIGSRLDQAVKSVPLTRNGLNWFQYKESRTVPYEADCAENEVKRGAREAAIEDGKLTPEEFDEAFASTPADRHSRLLEELDGTLGSLEALGQLCDDRFGDVAPNFSPLRGAVEEVKQTVRILLGKLGTPQPEVEPAAVVEEAAETVEAPSEQAVAPRARRQVAAEPASQEEAYNRVTALAQYLRRESPYSPVAYLLLRALRWGELRNNGTALDSSLLEAPATELRQRIKQLAQEGQWEGLLETAETAMGSSCGRAWLDLQRYVVRACQELGSWYEPIAVAVQAELRSLLQDFPQLPDLTLIDDTPVANPDTQAWLKEILQPPPESPAPLPVVEKTAPPEEQESPTVDAYELAVQAMRSNRPEEAIEILSLEIAQVRSGRLRFQRKIQLAQVCMASGHEAIAYPILEELAGEIEQRNLEDWEAPDMLAHPLALLLKCMAKLDTSAEEKRRIYGRICRLDPLQALSCPE